MRILIVSSAFYPYPSGVSEAVYYLTKGLKDRGHNIKVLTANYPNKWPDKPIDDLDIIRLGKIIFIPMNKSFATTPFSADMPFQVKRFLEKSSFDVIHLHGVFPPEIGFWVLHFSRTVNCATFHSTGFKNPFPPFFSFLFNKYNRKLHGKIAISETTRKWIELAISGEYRIIPNGVDCVRFSPLLPPSKRNEKSPVILFVGRLDERKGVLIAIRTFKQIIQEFPSAQLLIIGKGPLESSAKKLTRDLNIENACVFLGYVERAELPYYYASCDVYVSPALGGEAQGLVLLEAMASGKVTIASDIAGYREVITNEQNGILFKTGSAQDLAAKVTAVLKNKEMRKFLEKNARTRAEEYDWKRIAKLVEDYYREIIQKSSKIINS